VKMTFKPAEVGWRLGRTDEPRGGELWVPWTAPPASSAPRGAARLLICLLLRFSRHPVRRW
jgi:type IV secretion system protein VirD4